MLLDIADSADLGFVVFDHRGVFLYANSIAKHNVPIIANKNHKKYNIKDFISLLYEVALDFSEEDQGKFRGADFNQNEFIFREFVSFDSKRIFLVDMRKARQGRIVFIFNDISERLQKETRILELNIRNNQLFQAIEASSSGIIISDPKQAGNPIVFANDTVCDFFKLRSDGIIRGGWDVILSLVEDHDVRASIGIALLDFEDLESELRFENEGDVRWLDFKLTAVEDDVGNLDYIVCIFSDVTPLKQKEAEFFQLQKLDALGQLAAGIAHDFNNILSIIDGYSVIAEKMTQSDPEKASEFMRKISISSKRGAALTQKMLTFSRHKMVSKTVIDLRAAILENKAFLQPILDKSVYFDLCIQDEPLPIRATPDAVGQVLINLCINARDAMPNGGDLLVNVARKKIEDLPENIRRHIVSDEIALISVSDNGVGMDKKTKERIFDPFFTTKPQGKGTGLGLSIVYGLVKEMGGVIDVQSAKGCGTQVMVYLPLCHEEISQKTIRVLEDGKGVRLDGYTALLAEDEAELCEAVQSILEGFGLKVLAAACGDEALVVQDGYEGDIDILITDVVMPGMNGVKLAELFTSLRPETKVVFMSGYPANGDMAPVTLPEGSIFIAKPVDYQHLAQLLGSILENKSLTSIKEETNNMMQLWV